MSRASFAPTALVGLLCAAVLCAADADRDFSGQWVLDPPSADAGALRPAPAASLSVTQTAESVECQSPEGKWSYAFDGGERQAQVAGETWNSAAKWDGATLVVSTLVTGAANYTLTDRWELARNQALLIVTRQVVRGASVSEAQFYYRRRGSPPAAAATPPASGLVRRPDPAPDAEFVVPTGTHVLLQLENRLDTKHSREGDQVYLRTAFPVYASQHLVIPQGATVLGTVTKARKPGQTKGELYIRFDSLTLPNGVTRDFRSRLGTANGAQGDVDREEGKITSPGNNGNETRGAIEGAGMGTAVGGIAGAAAGHPVAGLGMGGAVGAAAGLARVMSKGRPDAVLPQGTRVEMILDRELRYRFDELR
jgi:hypothetical protein